MELKSIINWAIILLFGLTLLISLLSYFSFKVKPKVKKPEKKREGTSGPFTMTISDEVKQMPVFSARSNAQPYPFTSSNQAKHPTEVPIHTHQTEKKIRNSAERMVVLSPMKQTQETLNKRYYIPETR